MVRDMPHTNDYTYYTILAERNIVESAHALLIAKESASILNNPTTEKAVKRADAALTIAMNTAIAVAIAEIKKARANRKQNWKSWM